MSSAPAGAGTPLALRTVQATRYVTPLREGGSVPAIMEADDDGLYVVKLRGAAQGPKALIAELLAGEIGRTLGLPVPEIVLLDLDPALARGEPDPELQIPLRASAGLNLALDYLPGSITYDPLVRPAVDAALASAVVWFDSYVTNVDRTPRNPNLLLWHKRLWLIDHGAALYFHHTWADWAARARSPFVAIRDHVLLRQARVLADSTATLAPRLTPAVLDGIIQAIPDGWLTGETTFPDPAATRAAYLAYLTARLDAAPIFVEEAIRARAESL
ncbi:MAG: aminotransferase class I and II [Chloroflexota bacterium]|nr:aminotransferase class I and II [Chloroflexota bacterium]